MATISAMTARLTGVILLGAVTCGCQAAHPAAPVTSATPAPTTPPAPRQVNIAPLPVRPVQKSQPTTPAKCPAMNPNAPTPSANVLITCDLGRTNAHIAFIRDDLVLETPIIEELVTSGQVAVTTQTAPAADQLAQLAGRPA